MRFLVAMPLLVAAELIVHQRMRPVVKQFLERRMIPGDAMPRFQEAIAAAFWLRDSVLGEILLIVFVYAVGILVVWEHFLAIGTPTWYATPLPGGRKLSLAGVWFAYVSLPVFQFLLIRWYLRLFIWARFLWHVSRIELSLIPTHPDRVGGLGFLSGTVYAFTLLAAAHGALLAGMLANRIFFLGAALPDFKVEIAVTVVFMLRAWPSALCRGVRAAAGQGEEDRQREYGTLSERYVRDFDAKWLRGGAAEAKHSSAAPTFNRSRTSGTASRSCAPCASPP